MEKFTCPICYFAIPKIIYENHDMQRCKCKALCVDCDENYTRFIGVMPMECSRYDEWYDKHNLEINIMRLQYRISLLPAD